MRLQSWKKQLKIRASFSLYLKCGAILLLFILSGLIVACGSNNSQGDPGNPAVTVTIRIGDFNGSPTPPLPGYTCGAWATNNSPTLGTTTIAIYAKFIHNVDGNPEGVGGATGTANVLWPDSSTDTVTATTTSDGLAVFPVVIKPIALNKVVLVDVTFSKPGVPTCTGQAAYFTLIIASPTSTATNVPSPSPTGAGTGTPTDTPTPGISPTPTKTPKPRKTPTPIPFPGN